MPTPRKSIPPYIRRGLAVLIIFLMGISISRLLVSMHQQQERIEILETQVAQLMADTTRLVIQPSAGYRRSSEDQHTRTTGNRHTTHYNNRPQPEQKSSHTDHMAASAHQSNDKVPTQTSGSGSNTYKFTEPHTFDLNTIDSLTLIRIPGIASRTAATILKNRQRYGGFCDPWQLQDFLTWEAAQAYMEDWCTRWFTADPSRIRHLPLNTASVSELQRHPYITHEQAVDIVRYRTRHNRISAPAELQQIPSLSAETVEKLLPYLSFE